MKQRILALSDGRLKNSDADWLRIGEVATRNSGIQITARRMKEMNDPNGNVKVFAGGQTTAMVSRNSLPQKSVYSDPSVIIKSRGIIDVEYCCVPFTHKSELWSYTPSPTLVDARFLAYYLKANIEILRRIASSTSVKMPQLSVRDTDNFLIPNLPIEVQREIADILDTFTKLEAELEAELEARRKQYSFYREKLLTPPPQLGNSI